MAAPADLIRKISEYQPASIGLDMVFPEPDRFSPGNVAEEIAIITPNLSQIAFLTRRVRPCAL